jgi:hypothetical protein
VHGHRLADDEAIADQLSDGLSGVGIGDFVHFVGIEPDLALSAAHDGRSETLLSTEVDPIIRCDSACALVHSWEIMIVIDFSWRSAAIKHR